MRTDLPISVIILCGALVFGRGAEGQDQTIRAVATQSAPVPAQSSAPSASATVLHASANLVLVDVVVTNGANAVHGLDRGRFHIFDNGHEKTVVSFDEHRATHAAAPSIVRPPPNTYTNLPVYAENGVVNVLLLDGLNTPVGDQVNLRRQMIDFLGKIQPGTSLAIFTLTSRLRMVEGFTTDAAKLASALKDPKAGARQSVALDPRGTSDVDEKVDQIEGIPGAARAIANLQQFAAEESAFQTDVQVHLTLEALQQLARYLSAIPGRKNLIWFSGSFPIALEPDDTLISPFRAMRYYADDVRATGKLLSAARVAVYPVDARGLMTLPTFNASYENTGNFDKGGNMARDDTRFNRATVNEHSTMDQIAEQTGGHAYVNTNGLVEAMANAIENGSSYYTIGYVPSQGKPDGQFHKIQLRVENGEYKLAYRRGYYADSEAKSAAPNLSKSSLLEEAVLGGAPQATQVLFKARVLTATDPLLQKVSVPSGPAGEMAAKLHGPVSRYVVQLRVDPHGIEFDETPEGTHRANVEFALIAYDSDQKRVNYSDHRFELNLKAEQYAQAISGGLPTLIPLDLPAGRLTLRIVIVDIAANRVGSLEIPIAVPGK
jgi:VWFA-related protein